jgi:hypothetical protein
VALDVVAFHVVALAVAAAVSTAAQGLVPTVALGLVPIAGLEAAPTAVLVVDPIAVLLERHKEEPAPWVAIRKQRQNLHNDPCHL